MIQNSHSTKLVFLLLLTLTLLLTTVIFGHSLISVDALRREQQQHTQAITSPPPPPSKDILPMIYDRDLKVDIIFKGLKYPTKMAFLGPNDILVLEKNTGMVRRIINRTMQPQPLLDVNVANKGERGMLGIAISKQHSNMPPYIFLYFTESARKDGTDVCTEEYCKPGNDPLGNRLYRYELINNKLVNPKLLLDLPSSPGPDHNGGAIRIGPDNDIFIPIGDLLINGYNNRSFFKTKAQNFENGTYPDGRAGILRISQDGKPIDENGTIGILDDKFPLNLYYAYGIRNSFGIDFDPVTGKLWDTENGPEYGDEVNLVHPGFNSGWMKVQGIWKPKIYSDPLRDPTPGVILSNPLQSGTLLDFDGRGKYSPPEFIWKQTVGPTAIKFLNSDKLGEKYENDVFVGDVNNGYLYHFDLNNNRSELSLKGPLEDKIANNPVELAKAGVIFGKGFGVITDIQISPYDGYMYILSHAGTIYRIHSRNN
jgi:aldose sugar dehydrogenase